MAPTTLLDWLKASTCPYPPRAAFLTDVKTTTPAHPRTDIAELRSWTGFADQVKANRERLASVEYDGPPLSQHPSAEMPVNSEQALTAVLWFGVLRSLSSVLKMLGHDFNISDPGGNKDTVAAPDLIGFSGGKSKPKIVGEVKTPWAFANVQDDIVSQWKDCSAVSHSVLERAVQQTYGYLTFNHVRYGFLTTVERTWFFRRSHAGTGGVLEVSNCWDLSEAQEDVTLLEALVYLILLIEEGVGDESWFYVSPTTSPWPARRRLRPRAPRNEISLTKRYDKVQFEHHAIEFHKGLSRRRVGCVFLGKHLGKPAVLKVVDASKHDSQASELAHEVEVYKALKDVHGKFVPAFIAFGELWGMLDVLVLEMAGDPLDDPLLPVNKSDMEQCLSLLHERRVLHGDPQPSNFVRDADGCLRILDFGLSKLEATPEELASETIQYE